MDKKIGSVKLQAEALEYEIADNTPSKISFKDKNGKIIDFNFEKTKSFNNRLCIEKKCEVISDPFKPVPCDYYSAETINFKYFAKDSSIVMEYTLFVDLYKEESKSFYDRMAISLSNENESLAVVYSFKAHAKDSGFDPKTFNDPIQIKERENFIIQSTKFDKILEAQSEITRVWIKEKNGIVGFRLKGIDFIKI